MQQKLTMENPSYKFISLESSWLNVEPLKIVGLSIIAHPPDLTGQVTFYTAFAADERDAADQPPLRVDETKT